MPKKIPELLAPAGSPEALMAGLDGGADAFYCGAYDFNARKRAKNFTRDDIEGATALLHSKGKKIYITLNTLIYDSELPQAIELLLFLNKIKVDAIIVQDLGIMYLISKNFPDLHIHASTQAFAHNRLQCEFLRTLGVKRIVLPREMSIEEISDIQKLVPLEYEIFIHGAMCFSFSGACLFSSYQFGASGNRGECRQVCRHSFTDTSDRGEFYPFSMKDLDSTPIFEKFLALNPASLKIEGRLKNSDYVYKTVSHYRKMLDSYALQGFVVPEDSLAGQRISSTGYFESKEYGNLVAPDSPGVTGEDIGYAEIIKRDEIILNVNKLLQKGSRIRITDEKGCVIYDGTLLKFDTRRKVSSVVIYWNSPDVMPIKGRLKVLLLGSTNHQDPTHSFKHALSERKLDVLSLSLEWKDDLLECCVFIKEKTVIKGLKYPLILEDARSPDAKNVLSKKITELFRGTGLLSFLINSISLNIPEGKFVPPSLLKSLRRQLFNDIHTSLAERKTKEEAALMENLFFDYEKQLSSCAISENVKIAEHNFEELKLNAGPEISPDSKTYLMLPIFVSDDKLPLWEEKIHELTKQGFCRFVAAGYGWLKFLNNLDKKLFVITGPYVYCTNRYTLSLLLKEGVSGFTLPMDINSADLSPINKSKFAGILSAYAKEYFITRIRLPKDMYIYKNRRYITKHLDEYDTLGLPVNVEGLQL
jgi:putative protease